MDKDTLRLFEIFRIILQSAHIPTKTTCKNFHEDSEKAYELAFDCFHLIAEARQDTKIDPPKDDEEVADETYALVEEIKTILQKKVGEKPDIGMDNLLRGLYERANSICGDMRRYVYEKEEEPEEKPMAFTPSKRIIKWATS